MGANLSCSANLTEKSDKVGVVLTVCDPGWFDKESEYQISNSPTRTANLVFRGDDLNFLARVLYAESSGSMQLADSDERAKEKSAILGVKHFRLNRTDYPNRNRPLTFRAVCEAPGQFESVFKNTKKFADSSVESYERLSKYECGDLKEAIEAVRLFMANGPDEKYIFDNFRGGAGSQGERIGLSRFWLSKFGKAAYEKEK